jgi:hypothetical protein
VLGHQFGQDLILGLHLLLQELDPFLLLLDLADGAFLRLEGGGSVLEELLLPAVEHRRLCRPSSSQRSETGTLSSRCRLRMATFSSEL